MLTTTMGLVLREVKTGESDRILTILTDKLGVVSASAKGSLRLKNKLFAATGLYCYSEFTLFAGKTMYTVDEADLQQNFYGLRTRVEAIAVATYLSELILTLQPQKEEGAELLRLALNSLYVLSEQPGSDPRLVKAVFELRAVADNGFRPDLLACTSCGAYEAGSYRFDLENGCFLCEDCCARRGLEPNTSRAVLAALRHIVYSDLKKIFSFSLAESSVRQLEELTDRYLLLHLDRPLKSRDFLRAVLM